MKFNQQNILDSLLAVCYPLTGIDIVSSGMVSKDIRIEGNVLYLSICFKYPNDFFAQSVFNAAEMVLKKHFGEQIYIITKSVVSL
jgi:Iron-sulfur cluster assembly protein